jgi:hypothetical protein
MEDHQRSNLNLEGIGFKPNRGNSRLAGIAYQFVLAVE